MAASKIYIKVKTEELEKTAGEVERTIKKLEDSFQKTEKVVKSVSSFWEGDGATEFINAFTGRSSVIQTSIRRLKENVIDLEQMAGVYKQAEKEAKEIARSLSSDVII